MVGSVSPAAGSAASAILTVPLARRPLDPDGPGDRADRIRGWYENELGWATVPGEPVRLLVGERFDVLDVPAEAGLAALRRLAPGSPVAARGDRLRLLVAAGGAEEVPGILRWLEWGALPLDLTAIGAGGFMEAPLPPDQNPGRHAGGQDVNRDPDRTPERDPSLDPDCGKGLGQGLVSSRVPGRVTGPLTGLDSPGPVQGAAVWLRPPVAGREVEASLPTMSAMGGAGGAPDLVRLVDTLATHCHRVRLRRASAQPLAFS
ncbi:SCO3374 family protein [Streptomyces soliscabiei]|uniref:SCO3374 family protein n=1 Tax=Streptomyces soliscabiei TaxID=588897 RepID=UPI0029B79E54|nr:SCO3374 family protein [Streptomyces sp. NY05-11A]MDX2683093.1 SCO3374 family protein [Streptomyces sp. NY05-11A]